MATTPRGLGTKGLSGRATKKRTFFAASRISLLFYRTKKKRYTYISTIDC